jgi:uncharacterized protein (TIRG00374 family)
MQIKSKLTTILQILLGLVLITVIIWYIGVQEVGNILLNLKITFLIYASIAYFIMNLLFAVRLKLVLKSSGHNIGLNRMLLIQYGGMLASDFTPARSGYFAVPVMLAQEKVPVTLGLSSILGIQSIEFLVKMVGGILALVYLVSIVNLSGDILIISAFGIALMLFGAILIFIIMWWSKAIKLIMIFERIPFIGKITKIVSSKILAFQKEAYKLKNLIAPILILTLISWVVKGVEWYFIGLAMDITQISLLGYLLLHPLITALSFVPITPSGIGFQEGGIVGIFYLLGVGANISIVFALLARFLLVIQDLIGAVALSRAGIKVLEIVSTIKK